MEVVRHGCLLNERIINALMVNGRRRSSTVRPIVAHDEVFLNRANASRKADTVSRDALKVIAVFRPGDLVDILFGAVEENQNRRDSVYGTQNGPIGLTGLGKVTTDDVVRLLREHLLRDRATAALELVDDVAWKFREGGRRKPNDVLIRLVEFAFQVFGELANVRAIAMDSNRAETLASIFIQSTMHFRDQPIDCVTEAEVWFSM